MRAGFAKREITPNPARDEVCNLGYWNERTVRFTGVRDPLFVRCAVLTAGDPPLVLVTVDAIFDSYGFSPRAATRVARDLGVPEANVWISCSHSHSTPLIGLNQTRLGENYGRTVEDAIVAAARAAWSRQREVAATRHHVPVPGALYNRRPLLQTGRVAELHVALDPACVADPGPLNDTLTLIQFRTPDGALAGAWCHFAIHGVCMQCSPLISSDCMGQAIQRTEADSRGEAIVLFTNGACGDVDPAAMGDAHALERTADLLHQALTAATRSAGLVFPFAPVRCRAGVFTARRRPTRDITELERARAALAPQAAAEHQPSHHSGAGYEYFLLGEERAVARLPPDVSIPYQLWQTGQAIWIGVAGEVFTQTGLDLARALDPQLAFVIGYTGGWNGYFCPRPAFKQGGYEVACASWSPLAPGEAERLFAHLLAEARALDHA
ncbi:MAG: hypothetical protein K8T26_11725 [Lentisphaerae bacterium]|nr:hypothetical protein [Lentisphaerota bacterium]